MGTGLGGGTRTPERQRFRVPKGDFRRNDEDEGAVVKVRIDDALCNSCGLCREVCPEGAIRPKLLEPRHLYEVQPEKCTGCGDCLDYCPAPGALVAYAAAASVTA